MEEVFDPNSLTPRAEVRDSDHWPTGRHHFPRAAMETPSQWTGGVISPRGEPSFSTPHIPPLYLLSPSRLRPALPAPQQLRCGPEAGPGAGAGRARVPAGGAGGVQRPREPTVKPVSSLLSRGGGRDRQLLHGRLLHL